ncbi:hypothetical protein [Pseudidiomarina aestuarii]|uniref:hypothetical protein n=1 Tax=Pseudidiomarina aestuarii TaxID=624146 RepID=UPI003A9810B4
MIVTYIITSEQKAEFETCLAECEISGLEGMFSTPLSADGQEPATHFISSGELSQEQVDWLDVTLEPDEFHKRLDVGPRQMMDELALQLVQLSQIDEFSA